MSTGANIRRLREQRGLTQEQLGKMVDVSRSTITQWGTWMDYAAHG